MTVIEECKLGWEGIGEDDLKEINFHSSDTASIPCIYNSMNVSECEGS